MSSYILNISFHCHPGLEEQIKQNLLERLLPAARTSLPEALCSVARIMLPMQADELSAFALRIEHPSLLELEAWHEGMCSRLLADMTGEYGENLVYFATYMQTIDE